IIKKSDVVKNFESDMDIKIYKIITSTNTAALRTWAGDLLLILLTIIIQICNKEMLLSLSETASLVAFSCTITSLETQTLLWSLSFSRFFMDP
ncbi:hypothetical protein ACJX0J_009784, partial [Zea mays]